ncbi:MAG: TolC family protein [Spirochaetales bacterium]|nr:TolC family protein [Spirochaetales bacterium]
MKRSVSLLILLILWTLPLFSQTTAPDSADSPEDSSGGTYTWELLYSHALSQNAAIAGKAAAATASEQQWKSAKRSRGPVLSFESDLSYLTNPRTVDIAAGSLYPGGTLMPGIDFPALPETDQSMPLTGNQWYSFRLVLEQPLFTSGKLAAQQNIYQSRLEISRIETEQQELTVKTEILSIVHSLSFLQEILDLITEQKKTAERFVSLTRDSYDSGVLSYSDMLGAQVKAREINLMENQILRQRNSAILHLEYLTGIEGLQAAQINTEFLPDMDLSDSAETLLSQAAQTSPAMRVLKQQVSAAGENLRAVKGSSYGRPDFGLRVELDFAGDSFPYIPEAWSLHNANVTGSLGIQALLADTGKAAADSKAAEAQLKQAELQYRDSLEQIRMAIGEELFSQNLNRENILYSQSRAEDDLEVARQRKEQWEAGYGMEQDYLLQMISWYSDLIYGLQEEISLAVSRYKLKAITGELP